MEDRPLAPPSTSRALHACAGMRLNRIGTVDALHVLACRLPTLRLRLQGLGYEDSSMFLPWHRWPSMSTPRQRSWSALKPADVVPCCFPTIVLLQRLKIVRTTSFFA